MSNLRSIKIWPRLVIAFLFFAVLTIVVGVYGIHNFRLANERSADMYLNNVLAVRDLAAAQKNLLLHSQTFVRALTETGDPPAQSATLQRAEKYWDLSKSKWDSYATSSANDDEKLLREEFKKEVSNYLKLANSGNDQLTHGNVADATKTISGPLEQSARKLDELLDKLIKVNLLQAEDSNSKNESGATQATWASIGLIAVAIVSALSLGLIITNSITAPIQHAVETAQQIAQKNLTKTISIEGADEISHLSRALQIMQDGLRSTLSTISGSSSQLAAASEEMNVVTEDMSRTINASNDQLQMAVTAVTELSASIDDVARNAEATSTSSESASDTVRQGRSKVGETKSAINNLTVQIGHAAGIVSELATKIEQVGNVLGVIGAIADQTNLLALNAAIEAARAGESGRGFSVVADEVRALAARTQTSTHEIANILGSVRMASENAASSMSVSSTMAEDTRKLADAADHALEQIAEVIMRIKEMNVTVATTTEEQAATAREVDRNIATIKGMSEQNATASLQVNSSSHELARIATELNGMVSTFQV